MRRKKMMGQLLVCLLMMGLGGCDQKQEAGDTEEMVAEETAAVSAQNVENGETISADDAGKEEDSDSVTGQGFKPPKGSHIDKNGNIVTPNGDSFSKDGGWQVPEGGRVDSQGRIYDKNGKLMGGGATVGSKG